jgi:hypothetical protein
MADDEGPRRDQKKSIPHYHEGDGAVSNLTEFLAVWEERSPERFNSDCGACLHFSNRLGWINPCRINVINVKPTANGMGPTNSQKTGRSVWAAAIVPRIWSVRVKIKALMSL